MFNFAKVFLLLKLYFKIKFLAYSNYILLNNFIQFSLIIPSVLYQKHSNTNNKKKRKIQHNIIVSRICLTLWEKVIFLLRQLQVQKAVYSFCAHPAKPIGTKLGNICLISYPVTLQIQHTNR